MAKTARGSISPSPARKATPCHTGSGSPTNWILVYVDANNSGRETVPRRIRLLYNRLAERIRQGHYKRWHFDLERANHPIEFIELFCRRSDGKHFGEPIDLDIFQKAAIQALYGFIDDCGNRQFQEILWLMGRKNGKTTMLGCLALYSLVADHEGSPEIYCCATKLDQAKLLYNSVCRMLSLSKPLLKHVKKRKTDVYFPANFGYIMPICSDSSGLDGLNSHFIIMDELHAITDPGLYEVLKQSTSARAQPILCMITTAGTVRESIFDQMYDLAVQVADGDVEDDRFLPLLYELDDPAEWTDPACWKKANPGLGTIKELSYLQDQVDRAHKSSARRKGVLCKDFNVRETTAEAWLGFDELNNTATFDMDTVRNCYAVGGVDLSSTTDLTAATLLIRKGGDIYCLEHCWIPEDVAEKKIREDKVPYDLWRDQGWMTFIPGGKIDYSYITKWFLKMRDEFQIYPMAVGYDSWGSTYWVKEMENEGFVLDPVIQGPKTESGPLKIMKADLAAKTINYNDNPVLKWCLSNAVAKTDSNENIALVKGKNPKRRIDGAMALMDAYVELERHDQDLRNMEDWQNRKG